MNNTDAVKTISVTAQRFISANHVQQYVDYLRDVGVSDAQIKSFCTDYVVANSDCQEGDDEGI